jgi:hypothetical protein
VDDFDFSGIKEKRERKHYIMFICLLNSLASALANVGVWGYLVR